MPETEEKIADSRLKSTSLLLIDVDGTLYRGLIMEEIVEEQIDKGMITRKDAEPIRKAIFDYHHGKKGQNTNIEALNSTWAYPFTGIPYDILLDHATDFIRRNKQNFYPHAEPVLNLSRKRNCGRWLISGEPDFVIHALALTFEVSGFCATEWEFEGNQRRFTGGIKNPMTSRLKEACAKLLLKPFFGYDSGRSIALVDSLNDIGLVKVASSSIVFGTPSKPFKTYLEKCGKAYKIVSPEQPDYIMDLIDRFTKPIYE